METEEGNMPVECVVLLVVGLTLLAILGGAWFVDWLSWRKWPW